MLKYKLNPKLLVNIVESKQKKKIDNYVSFALEDADDNASARNEILEIEHVPENIEKFLKIKPTGWACWSFSNHDVIRHVSRWCRDLDSKRLLAKQAAAILLSLEGSVCLFQGEEVGQLESELEFSELTVFSKLDVCSVEIF